MILEYVFRQKISLYTLAWTSGLDQIWNSILAESWNQTNEFKTSVHFGGIVVDPRQIHALFC